MTILDPSPENITTAARLIRAGDLVAFPTETVYGLCADATNPQAVARIFAAKTRPRINPLIAHVSNIAAARALGEFPPLAEALAARFWPGPLTLVVKRSDNCPVADLATAGLDTIALRVPRHPIARALLTASGVPIAAPSANRSGEPSPTDAAHVEESLGHDIPVLDGGPAEAGLESTIIGFAGERAVLLRLGAIARDAILQITGDLIDDTTIGTHPRSPGQMLRHYAPRKKLALDVTTPENNDAYLAFGPVSADHAHVFQLSARQSLAEAAANLFRMLRLADRTPCARIAVAPIASHGLGEAINDRLRRAANAGNANGQEA